MAVICPKCGYDNVRGSLFCAECYTLLADTIPVPHTVTLNKSDIQRLLQKQTQLPGSRTQHIGKLGTHAIALYINLCDDPLIVLITSQTVFGRAVPGDNQPRVDLTPYGALDKGVSRQHAIIKRVEKGLTVEDMGSSNGSWLNGELLRPYTPLPLKSGDRLRLSEMEMDVFLPEDGS